MGKTLRIRDMELGAGRPKICVPISGKTEVEILKEVELALEADADLIEWRADYFAEVENPEETKALGKKIRKRMGDKPILFTYRTEGSDHSIELRKYIELNQYMADAGDVDLIDIEYFMGEDVCRDFCEYAHQRKKAVILSCHDFEKTPDEQEIVERLKKMRQLGADIPKIAVMPQDALDVLTLMSATYRYVDLYSDSPVITMSMKWLGAVSRICGEVFGSSLTFGSTLRASAPGQLAVSDLKYILEALQHPSAFVS